MRIIVRIPKYTAEFRGVNCIFCDAKEWYAVAKSFRSSRTGCAAGSQSTRERSQPAVDGLHLDHEVVQHLKCSGRRLGNSTQEVPGRIARNNRFIVNHAMGRGPHRACSSDGHEARSRTKSCSSGTKSNCIVSRVAREVAAASGSSTGRTRLSKPFRRWRRQQLVGLMAMTLRSSRRQSLCPHRMGAGRLRTSFALVAFGELPWRLRIVKRSDVVGCEVLSKRWIVETDVLRGSAVLASAPSRTYTSRMGGVHSDM